MTQIHGWVSKFEGLTSNEAGLKIEKELKQGGGVMPLLKLRRIEMADEENNEPKERRYSSNFDICGRRFSPIGAGSGAAISPLAGTSLIPR